jgi:flagellar motor component MotA
VGNFATALSETLDSTSKYLKLAKNLASLTSALGVVGALSGVITTLIFGDPVEKKLEEISNKLDSLSRQVNQGFDSVKHTAMYSNCKI